MIRKIITCLFFLPCISNAELGEPATETSLNTANNIRAAWEIIRLAESLAPNVDTRCYVAKFAASKASSLEDSANVIKSYASNDSDAFALQSIEKAMKIVKTNNVQEIANECSSKSAP